MQSGTHDDEPTHPQGYRRNVERKDFQLRASAGLLALAPTHDRQLRAGVPPVIEYAASDVR
jgi:hypothetical protein